MYSCPCTTCGKASLAMHVHRLYMTATQTTPSQMNMKFSSGWMMKRRTCLSCCSRWIWFCSYLFFSSSSDSSEMVVAPPPCRVEKRLRKESWRIRVDVFRWRFLATLVETAPAILRVVRSLAHFEGLWWTEGGCGETMSSAPESSSREGGDRRSGDCRELPAPPVVESHCPLGLSQLSDRDNWLLAREAWVFDLCKCASPGSWLLLGVACVSRDSSITRRFASSLQPFVCVSLPKCLAPFLFFFLPRSYTPVKGLRQSCVGTAVVEVEHCLLLSPASPLSPSTRPNLSLPLAGCRLNGLSTSPPSMDAKQNLPEVSGKAACDPLFPT